MEEWVGQQWDRFIRRAAHRQHDAAAVTLGEMQRTLHLMFRAAGGAAAVRVAPAAEARVGGARDWLQRVAGTGTHAATGRLEPEALSLPPVIAVHAEPALNRALYLWLAALAAHIEPTGEWIADNRRATQRALATFPGLAERHRQLLAAETALRPEPSRLRGRAAEAERSVQQALAAQGDAPVGGVRPDEVAPVWLWLDTTAAAPAASVARDQDPEAAGAGRPLAAQDARRRRAQTVADDRDKAPLMMFFRAESILSWGEFVKVNRASDDDDDGNALAAANDMDVLAIAPDGQTTASRVKFDLDLPSAAADDRPLGPGTRLPEWDWRKGQLIEDHCALQTLVTAEPPPFVPPSALRVTARRVRRRMEVLRGGMGRLHAQPEGDELDLDAWVRHAVEAAAAPRSESPAVFSRRVRSERSLATLLLADLSLSTDAYATQTARVIDVIRDALYVFGEALSASGDPFEMLGFSSVRRQNVRIHQLKGFDEAWGPRPRDRVGAIKPGYYTRMGAAIRHATARLAQRPERQRLLLLLTDGKPNDLDVYEGRYGLEDTRHAVQAARAAGLLPFCITIDETAHDYLPALFGDQGYALVRRPQELVNKLSAVHQRFMARAA
ncbi:nitric oxide reductase activation protein NorD [Hydrogenophaga pseudoflava]|uniref:nitric oxide reductase activation protein NorD n=1 Tax=Hydrogenophaga pseudoflava TaxID=47421 RepID=UPI0027E3E859|nr:VWA domain-containing protein [Hydrogenophaga pseudoflava]MDQ7743051.1 VWA domain-containing protein [Hydrogenophaga pseudoflava]